MRNILQSNSSSKPEVEQQSNLRRRSKRVNFLGVWEFKASALIQTCGAIAGSLLLISPRHNEQFRNLAFDVEGVGMSSSLSLSSCMEGSITPRERTFESEWDAEECLFPGYEDLLKSLKEQPSEEQVEQREPLEELTFIPHKTYSNDDLDGGVLHNRERSQSPSASGLLRVPSPLNVPSRSQSQNEERIPEVTIVDQKHFEGNDLLVQKSVVELLGRERHKLVPGTLFVIPFFSLNAPSRSQSQNEVNITPASMRSVPPSNSLVRQRRKNNSCMVRQGRKNNPCMGGGCQPDSYTKRCPHCNPDFVEWTRTYYNSKEVERFPCYVPNCNKKLKTPKIFRVHWEMFHSS